MIIMVEYMKKTIKGINEEYELELGKVVQIIKRDGAKKVVLQFPDGLKPYAVCVAEEVEKKSGSEIMIWFGTCFGACDVPLEVEKLGIDLIVQFGHTKFVKTW